MSHLLIPLLFLVGVLCWRRRRKCNKRSSLVTQLLRSPGESLRNQIEDAQAEISTYLSMTPAVILMLYASHLSQSYLLGQPETWFRYAVSALMAVGMLAFGYRKIVTYVRHRENLRQGYEGELAVGQELNQLMRQGAWVFHDVPAEGFNIDHVVIAPNGVYAVETKARMKPNRSKGAEDAKVVFDGKVLVFPTWTETAAVEQAIAQARWLAQWLSSAAGEKVEVKAAIALPGWFVQQSAPSGVAVFNPKNTAFLQKGWLKEPMPEVLIRRIAHQLDQRCRDVEPSLFVKKSFNI